MTQVGPQALSGWEAFAADRTARRDAATDEGLRAHFEAELKQAEITLQAMGGTPTTGAPPPPEAPAEAEAKTDPTAAPPIPEPEPAASGGGEGLSTNLPEALRPYADDIAAASKATGVPENLLAAVIWDESKGIAHAGTVNGENGQTDTGLMQVNPATFAALKDQHPDLLTGGAGDPASNIMAGALYLAENKQEFGTWDLALRAYNSGPLSVDPTDHTVSTTGFGTQNYVEKVNFYADLLNDGKALPDGYPGGNVMY